MFEYIKTHSQAMRKMNTSRKHGAVFSLVFLPPHVQIHGQTEFMQKTSDLRKSDIEMYFAGTDAKRARSYAIISIEDMNKRQAVNSILVKVRDSPMQGPSEVNLTFVPCLVPFDVSRIVRRVSVISALLFCLSNQYFETSC